VSLVVFDYLWSVGYLRTRFLDESLIYILRENSGRTEELIGYWVIQQRFGLFIRITNEYSRFSTGIHTIG
jgi:hypothetical protein